MALILPGNVASATADAGYNIANSCRFNFADSPSLKRTPSSASNRRTWTFSVWVKRSKLGSLQVLWNGTTGGYPENIYFDAADKLEYDHDIAGTDYTLTSSMVFRDVSAWYHIVIAKDTTDSTEANRLKVYVNGTQITMNETANGYPAEDFEGAINDDEEHVIGDWCASGGCNSYFIGGYLAEITFIDGLQLAATSFGEFNSDSPTIWQPIDVSGLTFGTNGFYLDFEDSGDLGDDESGNGNDFTEANLAAADQATDTPTNNFCTFNPLDNYYPSATFSEGNMQVQTDSSAYTYTTSTFGVSTGKWYWEVEYDAKSGGSDWALVGITSNQSENNNSNWLGENQYDYSYYGLTGVTYTNNGSATYGNTFAPGDIVGVALNIDDNEIKFYKNNTVQNSGTAISIAAASSGNLGVYIPAICFFDASYNGTFKGNFGGCSAFAISSAAADGNGYGAFEYAPPSGFYALCTKNLAEYG